MSTVGRLHYRRALIHMNGLGGRTMMDETVWEAGHWVERSLTIVVGKKSALKKCATF